MLGADAAVDDDAAANAAARDAADQLMQQQEMQQLQQMQQVVSNTATARWAWEEWAWAWAPPGHRAVCRAPFVYVFAPYVRAVSVALDVCAVCSHIQPQFIK
jgi:hypothetical protein